MRCWMVWLTWINDRLISGILTLFRCVCRLMAYSWVLSIACNAEGGLMSPWCHDDTCLKPRFFRTCWLRNPRSWHPTRRMSRFHLIVHLRFEVRANCGKFYHSSAWENAILSTAPRRVCMPLFSLLYYSIAIWRCRFSGDFRFINEQIQFGSMKIRCCLILPIRMARSSDICTMTLLRELIPYQLTPMYRNQNFPQELSMRSQYRRSWCPDSLHWQTISSHDIGCAK